MGEHEKTFTSLNFTQQLQAVTEALDSNHEEKIRSYLNLFLQLYDPATKYEEIVNHKTELNCKDLLSRLLDKMHFAPPLVFLGYMRILALLADFEENIHSTEAVSTVLDVMQDNKDPEVQISGLKFLANLTQNATVRNSIASKCLEYVMVLLDSEEYSKNYRILKLACLLLANLSVESAENKELIGVDAIPPLISILNSNWDIEICMAVLFVFKNLVTKSTTVVIDDLIQNRIISAFIHVMKNNSKDLKCVKLIFDIFKCIFHENASTKGVISSDEIIQLIETISLQIDNSEVVLSGITVLLQLAKLTKHRQTMGQNRIFDLLSDIISKHNSNPTLMIRTSALLERLCASPNNLTLLNPTQLIPQLSLILQTYSSIDSILLSTLKLINRLSISSIQDVKPLLKSSLKTLLKTLTQNPHSNVVIKKWLKKSKKSIKTESDSDSSDSDDELNFDEDINKKNLYKKRATKKDFNLDDLVLDLERTNKKKKQKKKSPKNNSKRGLMDFDDDLDFGEMLLNDVAPGMEEDFQVPKPSANAVHTPRRKKRDPVYRRGASPKSSGSDSPGTPKLGSHRSGSDDDLLGDMISGGSPKPQQKLFKQKIIPYKSTFNRQPPKPETSSPGKSSPSTEKKKSIFDDDFDFDDVIIHEDPPQSVTTEKKKSIFDADFDFDDLVIHEVEEKNTLPAPTATSAKKEKASKEKKNTKFNFEDDDLDFGKIDENTGTKENKKSLFDDDLDINNNPKKGILWEDDDDLDMAIGSLKDEPVKNKTTTTKTQQQKKTNNIPKEKNTPSKTKSLFDFDSDEDLDFGDQLITEKTAKDDPMKYKKHSSKSANDDELDFGAFDSPRREEKNTQTTNTSGNPNEENDVAGDLELDFGALDSALKSEKKTIKYDPSDDMELGRELLEKINANDTIISITEAEEMLLDDLGADTDDLFSSISKNMGFSGIQRQKNKAERNLFGDPKDDFSKNSLNSGASLFDNLDFEDSKKNTKKSVKSERKTDDSDLFCDNSFSKDSLDSGSSLFDNLDFEDTKKNPKKSEKSVGRKISEPGLFGDYSKDSLDSGASLFDNLDLKDTKKNSQKKSPPEKSQKGKIAERNLFEIEPKLNAFSKDSLDSGASFFDALDSKEEIPKKTAPVRFLGIDEKSETKTKTKSVEPNLFDDSVSKDILDSGASLFDSLDKKHTQKKSPPERPERKTVESDLFGDSSKDSLDSGSSLFDDCSPDSGASLFDNIDLEATKKNTKKSEKKIADLNLFEVEPRLDAFSKDPAIDQGTFNSLFDSLDIDDTKTHNSLDDMDALDYLTKDLKLSETSKKTNQSKTHVSTDLNFSDDDDLFGSKEKPISQPSHTSNTIPNKETKSSGLFSDDLDDMMETLKNGTPTSPDLSSEKPINILYAFSDDLASSDPGTASLITPENLSPQYSQNDLVYGDKHPHFNVTSPTILSDHPYPNKPHPSPPLKPKNSNSQKTENFSPEFPNKDGFDKEGLIEKYGGVSQLVFNKFEKTEKNEGNLATAVVVAVKKPGTVINVNSDPPKQRRRASESKAEEHRKMAKPTKLTESDEDKSTIPQWQKRLINSSKNPKRSSAGRNPPALHFWRSKEKNT